MQNKFKNFQLFQADISSSTGIPVVVITKIPPQNIVLLPIYSLSTVLVIKKQHDPNRTAASSGCHYSG